MRSFTTLLPLLLAVFSADSVIAKASPDTPSLLGSIAETSFRFVSSSKDSLDANISSLLKTRQANPLVKPRTRSTIVAPGPDHVGLERRQVASVSLPATVVLRVTQLDGTFRGYFSASGAFPGDYYINADLTNALRVSATLGTTSIQELPIVSGGGAGAYGFLAGMVGPINSGYNAPPYIPSADFSTGNYNFAFITSAPHVTYGPAQFSPNADNEQTRVQTGMFRFQDTTSNILVPNWVNSDGTVPAGQGFGIQDDALFVSSNVVATNVVFSAPTRPVIVTAVLA